MMSKLLSIAPKINMEPENDGLIQMFFLFQGCILGFQAVHLRGCTQKVQVPKKQN